MIDLALLFLVVAAITFIIGAPLALALPALLPAVLATPSVDMPVSRVDVVAGWSSASALDTTACAVSPSSVFTRFRARTVGTVGMCDTCQAVPIVTDRHGHPLTGAAAQARARRLARTASHRETMRRASCEGKVRK